MLSVVNTGEKNTYCVMDLKKWFEGAGYSFNAQLIPDRGAIPEQQELEKDFILYDQKMRMISDSELQDASARRSGSVNMTRSTEMNDDPTEIVVLLQVKGNNKYYFRDEVDIIDSLSEYVFTNKNNAKIAVILYNDNSAVLLTDKNNQKWFTKSSILKAELNSVERETPVQIGELGNAVNKMVTDLPLTSGYRRCILNFMIASVHADDECISKLQQLVQNGAVYSEIMTSYSTYTNNTNSTAIENLISAPQGYDRHYLDYHNEVDFYKVIYSETPSPLIRKEFFEFELNKFVTLTSSLTRNGTNDSDNDGVSDWDEINKEHYLVRERSNCDIILPYVEEYIYKFYPLMYETAGSYGIWDQNVNCRVVPVKTDLKNPDTDGDGYSDSEDLNPTVPYKNPVILLHGWNGNSSCFGIKTSMCSMSGVFYNNTYGRDSSTDGGEYSQSTSHIIINNPSINVSIDDGLGKYLIENGYKENKNLFAYNYANKDMVEINAKMFKRYIDDLIYRAQINDVMFSGYQICDEKYLFPTELEKNSGSVKFDLVGYSMGGLIARYYTENLGYDYMVRKIIEIDTPNYGAYTAKYSYNLNELTSMTGLFNPGVFDLVVGSSIFTGIFKENAIGGWSSGNEISYALKHQSNKLNGNRNLKTKYYSISGIISNAQSNFYTYQYLNAIYSGVNNGFSFDFSELRKIPNTTVLEISLSLSTTLDSLLNMIEDNIMSKYRELYEIDNDFTTFFEWDDNVVGLESQLGIQFNEQGILKDKLVFEKQCVIIDNTAGHTVLNNYHQDILSYEHCFKKVGEYLNA